MAALLNLLVLAVIILPRSYCPPSPHRPGLYFELIGPHSSLALMLGANNVDMATGTGEDYHQR